MKNKIIMVGLLGLILASGCGNAAKVEVVSDASIRREDANESDTDADENTDYENDDTDVDDKIESNAEADPEKLNKSSEDETVKSPENTEQLFMAFLNDELEARRVENAINPNVDYIWETFDGKKAADSLTFTGLKDWIFEANADNFDPPLENADELIGTKSYVITDMDKDGEEELEILINSMVACWIFQVKELEGELEICNLWEGGWSDSPDILGNGMLGSYHGMHITAAYTVNTIDNQEIACFEYEVLDESSGHAYISINGEVIMDEDNVADDDVWNKADEYVEKNCDGKIPWIELK